MPGGYEDDDDPLSYNNLIRKTIDRAADKWGVDRAIAHGLAFQESKYNPHATGPMTRYGWKAKGLTQISPDVAAQYGVKNIYDPEENANAGMGYLRSMIDKYGPDMGVAAYNMGPGNADKVKAGHMPMPAQTKEYVPLVQQYANQYRKGQPLGPRKLTKTSLQTAANQTPPTALPAPGDSEEPDTTQPQEPEEPSDFQRMIGVGPASKLPVPEYNEKTDPLSYYNLSRKEEAEKISQAAAERHLRQAQDLTRPAAKPIYAPTKENAPQSQVGQDLANAFSWKGPTADRGAASYQKLKDVGAAQKEYDALPKEEQARLQRNLAKQQAHEEKFAELRKKARGGAAALTPVVGTGDAQTEALVQNITKYSDLPEPPEDHGLFANMSIAARQSLNHMGMTGETAARAFGSQMISPVGAMQAVPELIERRKGYREQGKKLDEIAAKDPSLFGKIVRGVTSGAMELPIYAAAGMTGPAAPLLLGAYAAAGGDWEEHPGQALFNTAAMAALPGVGKLAHPLLEAGIGKVLPSTLAEATAEKVAQKGASLLSPAAIMVGQGEVGAHGRELETAGRMLGGQMLGQGGATQALPEAVRRYQETPGSNRNWQDRVTEAIQGLSFGATDMLGRAKPAEAQPEARPELRVESRPTGEVPSRSVGPSQFGTGEVVPIGRRQVSAQYGTPEEAWAKGTGGNIFGEGEVVPIKKPAAKWQGVVPGEQERMNRHLISTLDDADLQSALRNARNDRAKYAQYGGGGAAKNDLHIQYLEDDFRRRGLEIPELVATGKEPRKTRTDTGIDVPGERVAAPLGETKIAAQRNSMIEGLRNRNQELQAKIKEGSDPAQSTAYRTELARNIRQIETIQAAPPPEPLATPGSPGETEAQAPGTPRGAVDQSGKPIVRQGANVQSVPEPTPLAPDQEINEIQAKIKPAMQLLAQNYGSRGQLTPEIEAAQRTVETGQARIRELKAKRDGQPQVQQMPPPQRQPQASVGDQLRQALVGDTQPQPGEGESGEVIPIRRPGPPPPPAPEPPLLPEGEGGAIAPIRRPQQAPPLETPPGQMPTTPAQPGEGEIIPIRRPGQPPPGYGEGEVIPITRGAPGEAPVVPEQAPAAPEQAPVEAAPQPVEEAPVEPAPKVTTPTPKGKVLPEAPTEELPLPEEEAPRGTEVHHGGPVDVEARQPEAEGPDKAEQEYDLLPEKEKVRGEHGKLAQGFFKASEPGGKDAVYNDPGFREALGVEPNASMGTVHKALARAIGEMRGVDPDTVSMSSVHPGEVIKWINKNARHLRDTPTWDKIGRTIGYYKNERIGAKPAPIAPAPTEPTGPMPQISDKVAGNTFNQIRAAEEAGNLTPQHIAEGKRQLQNYRKIAAQRGLDADAELERIGGVPEVLEPKPTLPGKVTLGEGVKVEAPAEAKPGTVEAELQGHRVSDENVQKIATNIGRTVKNRPADEERQRGDALEHAPSGGTAAMPHDRLLPGAEQIPSAESEKGPPLSAKELEIETRFRNYLATHTEEAVQRYFKKFGKEINTDNVRELSEEYANFEGRQRYAPAVHEPSSWLAKKLLAEMVKLEPAEGQKRQALYTAGGSGAGKSSLLRKLGLGHLIDDSQFIFDSNLHHPKKAIQKIDQALKEGIKVEIVGVYRDPMDSLNGVLQRARNPKNGRMVAIKTMVETHGGMMDSLGELAEHYKDNPNVKFTYVDNSRGQHKAVIVDRLVDAFKTVDHTEYERQLHERIEELYRSDEIPEAVYRIAKGEPPEGPGGGAAVEARAKGGVELAEVPGGQPEEPAGRERPGAPEAAAGAGGQLQQADEGAGAGGGRQPEPDQPQRANLTNPTADDIPEDIKLGPESTRETEQGTRVKGHYAVVEGDRIKSSFNYHTMEPIGDFPQELQGRNKGRAAADAQLRGMAAGLKAHFLMESPQVTVGAPTAAPNLELEVGRTRYGAIQLALENNGPRGKAYRDGLAMNAEDYGTTPEAIEGMRKPTLVFIRTTPVDRVKFAAEGDETPTTTMTPIEQAHKDVKNLESGLMDKFVSNDEGNLNLDSNLDFIRGFIGKLPVSEQGTLLTKSGKLNSVGLTRVRNAVFNKAYGHVPEGEALLDKLSEATDDTTKNITNAMVMRAPAFARLRSLIEKGARHDLDVSGDLAVAANKISDLKESGLSLEKAKEIARSQPDMFNQPKELTPFQEQLVNLLEKNKRSPSAINDIFTAFTDGVEDLGNPKQPNILGERKIVPSKELAVASAEKAVYEERAAQKVRDQERAAERAAAKAESARSEPGLPGIQEGNTEEEPDGGEGGAAPPAAPPTNRGEGTTQGPGVEEELPPTAAQGVGDVSDRTLYKRQSDWKTTRGRGSSGYTPEPLLQERKGPLGVIKNTGPLVSTAKNARARVFNVPGQGARVWLNYDATHLVGSVLYEHRLSLGGDRAEFAREQYDGFLQTEGINTGVGEINRTGDFLQKELKKGTFDKLAPTDRARVEKIASDFQSAKGGKELDYTAGGPDREVSIINARTERPGKIANAKTVARHEQFHGAMGSLVGDEYLQNHPLGNDVREALWDRGYTNPATHAAEAAAYMASGDHAQFNFHPDPVKAQEMANEYLTGYLDYVAKNHGAEAIAQVKNLDPAVREAVRDVQRRYGVEPEYRAYGGTGGGAEPGAPAAGARGGTLRPNERGPEGAQGMAGPRELAEPEGPPISLFSKTAKFRGEPQATATQEGTLEDRHGGFGVLGKIPGLQSARQAQDAMRTVETLVHLTAPFKQGLWYSVTKPQHLAETMGNMFKSFKDSNYESAMEGLMSTREGALSRKAGIWNAGEGDMARKIYQYKAALKAHGEDMADVNAIMKGQFGTKEPNELGWNERREAIDMLSRWAKDVGAKQPRETPEQYKERITHSEEAFQSPGLEKVPILGAWARKSKNTYNAFLDTQRQLVFRDYVKQLEANGKTFESHPQVYKDLATLINSHTGRGDLGEYMNKHSDLLGMALFSPRYIKSRLDFFNPNHYVGVGKGALAPEVRQANIKEAVRFVSTIGGMMALAKLGGADIGMDPTKSDFAKVKWGGRTTAVLGGYEDYVRFFAQTAQALYRQQEGTLGRNEKTAADVIGSFVRGKSAPGVSLGTDIATGTTFQHQPTNIKKAIAERFTPFFLNDLKQAIEEGQSPGQVAVGAGLGLFGARSYPTEGRPAKLANVDESTPLGKEQIRHKIAEPLTTIDIEKDQREPSNVFKARRDKVSGWWQEYGTKLVESDGYKKLTPMLQERALNSLRDRLSEQGRLKVPNLARLNPDTLIGAAFRAEHSATRGEARRERTREWTPTLEQP